MVCHLLVIKPLPKLMLTHCELDPKQQMSVKFVFVDENAFENVVFEISAI